jgi:hypothetical protein
MNTLPRGADKVNRFAGSHQIVEERRREPTPEQKAQGHTIGDPYKVELTVAYEVEIKTLVPMLRRALRNKRGYSMNGPVGLKAAVIAEKEV